MTLPIARDLSKIGIRVNTIAPGMINTPLFAGLPQDSIDSLSAAVLYPQRLGTPEEIGKLAAAIIDNDYINGETIRMMVASVCSLANKKRTHKRKIMSEPAVLTKLLMVS